MTTLRFNALDIPTCDAYYIHFSTSNKSPECYLVINGRKPNISFMLKNLTTEMIISNDVLRVELLRTAIHIELDNKRKEIIDGISKIEIAFEVNDIEFEEIKRQLQDILGRQSRNLPASVWQVST